MPDPPSRSPLLVRDLHATFGRRVALDGLNLDARAGQVLVILGPNGAGKTTLVRCCSGLVAYQGSIDICGLTPPAAIAAGKVAVMPQSFNGGSQLRVGELLSYLASMHQTPLDPRELAERLGVADTWRTPFRQLSGGQRQACNLIATVLGRPELVFLDEPTAGMDPRARRTTWSIVTELAGSGVAVILTTHAMGEAAELGDEVVIMDQGQIRAQGSVSELTNEDTDLEAVFMRHTSDPLDRIGPAGR